MNILGLSAYYHESACCLLRDGRLVAAAAEERFSRIKHDARLPVKAFRFCLEAGELTPADLDAIAYYESPSKKLERQLWAGTLAGQEALDAERPSRDIRERLGYEGRFLTFDHHQSHAASAFFFSGFDEAAILTADGVGEWATTTYGRGRGGTLELFEEVRFPHSLGLLYAAVTAYLGFQVNDGEYKVMGLAPYGRPRLLEKMRRLVALGPRGQFTLDMTYFGFPGGGAMYTPSFCDLLGGAPRRAGQALSAFHRDVACSLQALLEEILLDKTRYLASRVDSANLCLAGGVALNCVANARIARAGPFKRLFVQPAAGDAGGSLGAAALAHLQLSGARPGEGPLTHVCYGPRWRPSEIAALLEATGLPSREYRQRQADLLEATVDRLAGGCVVGWFQGAMEFGPRALGGRSILADPRDPGVRERLNRLVKRREAFRPFAPSVLQGRAAAHFDLDHPSPFMLETCRVTSPLELPAITHVDGSARPQTVEASTSPRFAALLEAFERRTGCPVLLNTSLNQRGEPIVNTPVDALLCMARAGLDALVLEDWILDRQDLPGNWAKLLRQWRTRPVAALARAQGGPTESLYTFV